MINALEKLFGRFSFIPYRNAKAAEVDPEIFSHLQLYIAAHPDIDTSCVLANPFRAIYMDSFALNLWSASMPTSAALRGISCARNY
jgi:hypothetical protein